MANTDIEIIVDDPTAPEPDSPAVTSTVTLPPTLIQSA
jgi:hypothetical protein